LGRKIKRYFLKIVLSWLDKHETRTEHEKRVEYFPTIFCISHQRMELGRENTTNKWIVKYSYLNIAH
jgi:hypothetical protein